MDRELKKYDPSPANLAALKKTAKTRTADGFVCLNPPDDKAAEKAISAGIMFAEPRQLGHDGWVAAARLAVTRVSAQDVSEAFLASLTSHRLDLRSALSSFAVARLLPEHPYEEWRSAVRCQVCGWLSNRPADLNDMSRHRFIYGGVALDDIKYVAFDLEQFSFAPRLEPRTDDIAIGQQLVDYLRQLPPKTTAAQAARGLKILKANANERDGILNSFGVCGILNNPGHPGYAHQFVPLTRRADPPGRFGFGNYPTWWWKAANGLDDAALKLFLPHLH